MTLLVVTDFPPDAPGGGPAVIRQMLKDFPGAVHWWSCRPSVRGSSFPVRGSASRKGRGFAEVAGGRWKVAGFEVASFACCPPGKLMPAHKCTRWKACLMEHIWARLAARSLRQTIQRVRPDTIWAIPHDFSIFPLANVFADDKSRMTNDRKIRVHVTIQDYPDVHGHGKLWGEARVQRMARLQEAIYAAADTRDATSHPMLDDLERRTGKRGLQMLHQGLEPEDFEYLEFLVRRSSFLVDRISEAESQSPELPTSKLQHKQETDNEKPGTRNQEPRTKNQEPIKIAYAGTILREPEFALFVNLLNSLINHQPSVISHQSSAISHQPSVINHQPSPIELHLFSAHSYSSRPWFDPAWMFEHGNLPERKLIAELRNFDWGFIPMALDDEDPRYNRFSFPTKFITYLAAGLPPIVMGHPESSVMKMAENHNVGVRITNDKLQRWKDLEKTAGGEGEEGSWFFVPCSSLASRKQGGEGKAHRPLDAILRCARAEFDADAMRRRLWEHPDFGGLLK